MKLPFGGEDILQVVDTPDIADPTEGTVEYNCALARDKSTYSVEAMPWLPQDPTDEWAKELYDRITESERAYAAPNLRLEDYEEGAAAEPDEIVVIKGVADNPYVFSAEHATSPRSVITGQYRGADTGTGGLAAVLAEDYGTAVIPTGRQTTNVPSVEEHPLKRFLKPELVSAVGFSAIHGKHPGMFVHPSDEVEIHACLGLGHEPTEAQREFAKKVILAAKEDLGLYVVISNDQPAYIQKQSSTEIKRLEDGSPKLSQLAGLKPTMTVNFSRNELTQLGRNVPAMQVELTRILRLDPRESSRRDKKSEIIGVALGYKLLETIVRLTFVEDSEKTAAPPPL